MTIHKHSSRSVLEKKVAPPKYAETVGKYLRQNLLYYKSAGLRPTTLLEKRPRHRRSTVNPAKLPGTPTFTENLPLAACKQIKKVLDILDMILYLSTYLNSSSLLILSSISDW